MSAPCSCEHGFAIGENGTRRMRTACSPRLREKASNYVAARRSVRLRMPSTWSLPVSRDANALTVTSTKTTIDISVDSLSLPCCLSPALARDGDPRRDLAVEVRREAGAEQRNSAAQDEIGRPIDPGRATPPRPAPPRPARQGRGFAYGTLGFQSRARSLPGFGNCSPEVTAIPNVRSVSSPKPYANALPYRGRGT